MKDSDGNNWPTTATFRTLSTIWRVIIKILSSEMRFT